MVPKHWGKHRCGAGRLAMDEAGGNGRKAAALSGGGQLSVGSSDDSNAAVHNTVPGSGLCWTSPPGARPMQRDTTCRMGHLTS